MWRGDNMSGKDQYSEEEFARRGDAIYQRDIQPRLTADQDGMFVAIDIESGAYEVDANEIAALDRLEARISDPQVWLRRVGSPYIYRFGSRDVSAAQP